MLDVVTADQSKVRYQTICNLFGIIEPSGCSPGKKLIIIHRLRKLKFAVLFFTR